MIRHLAASTACLAMLVWASASQATTIGFGQLGGSNTAIPGNLGSNAVADGNGYVVSNGATPNVALTWDDQWDIHTSGHFGKTEDLTVGGGDWDNEGGIPRIAQLDQHSHTIGFAAEPGYAVVLNSFDLGNTAETSDTSVWDLILTDSDTNTVWSQQVTLTNPDTDTVTISPGFTGTNGGSYTLAFNQVGDPLTPQGRHAIDNLSFNQVTVPEPTSLVLVCLGVVSLVARRGR